METCIALEFVLEVLLVDILEYRGGWRVPVSGDIAAVTTKSSNLEIEAENEKEEPNAESSYTSPDPRRNVGLPWHLSHHKVTCCPLRSTPSPMLKILKKMGERDIRLKINFDYKFGEPVWLLVMAGRIAAAWRMRSVGSRCGSISRPSPNLAKFVQIM